MDTIPAQTARDQLELLIHQATEEKRQYRITSDEGNVILVPEETYENLLVTLELLSTPGLLDTLRAASAEEESAPQTAFAH